MSHYSLLDLVQDTTLLNKQEDLNANALMVRRLLKSVEGRGHLYDLEAVFMSNNREHLVYLDHKARFRSSAMQLFWVIANPQLSDDHFILAMAFFAPVINNQANVVLKSARAERLAEAERIQAEHDARTREHLIKRGDIVVIDNDSNKFSIRQLWVASKAEYLEYQREYQLSSYHPSGYGTRVSDIVQETTGEHEGKFTCSFYRSTSCD